MKIQTGDIDRALRRRLRIIGEERVAPELDETVQPVILVDDLTVPQDDEAPAGQEREIVASALILNNQATVTTAQRLRGYCYAPGDVPWSVAFIDELTVSLYNVSANLSGADIHGTVNAFEGDTRGTPSTPPTPKEVEASYLDTLEGGSGIQVGIRKIVDSSGPQNYRHHLVGDPAALSIITFPMSIPGKPWRLSPGTTLFIQIAKPGVASWSIRSFEMRMSGRVFL